MEETLYNQYRIQSDLQRQQAENQTILHAPQMQERLQEQQAVLVAQTNPNKIVKDILLALKNMEEQPNGEIKKLGNAIINDLGVDRIRFLLRSIINQSTILSHLEERQISKLMIQLSNDLVDDLSLNWRSYGIKDKTMLDYIVDSVIYPAFFALQRALEQNEKNWLGRISVESISGGPINQHALMGKKNKSWMDKFKI